MFRATSYHIFQTFKKPTLTPFNSLTLLRSCPLCKFLVSAVTVLIDMVRFAVNNRNMSVEANSTSEILFNDGSPNLAPSLSNFQSSKCRGDTHCGVHHIICQSLCSELRRSQSCSAKKSRFAKNSKTYVFQSPDGCLPLGADLRFLPHNFFKDITHEEIRSNPKQAVRQKMNISSLETSCLESINEYM